MNPYEVIIERTAEHDLANILRYITENLHAPDAAKRIYSSIKESIFSLNHSPYRHQNISEDPYASLNVRCMFVENYIIFYIACEDPKEVHILRVLYKRRQWQDLI